jgi:hypothetical protein
MKKSFVRVVFATFICGVSFIGCKDDVKKVVVYPNELGSDNESSKNYPSGSIELGNKLENPYDLEVMQKAYNNIFSPNGRTNAEKLKETHLYIKFMPADEKEFMILKSDSTLILYNYPLDYEIKLKGNSYQDPEVSVGKPTYQYCAVETKKNLPKGVKYKVLAKLYIPQNEDGKFLNVPNGRLESNEAKKALEYEAFRLTNNLDDLKSSNGKNARVAAYRPAGRILVWDNSLNTPIGVEGVEVRARRWFTTQRGFADENGFYSCDGTFDNDANYSIDWERYNFAIRDGWLSGATYNGPKQSGNWNLNLISGAQLFYARIFRAGFRYYYKDINGLRRPPENSFWNTQLHIRAFNEDNSDINGSHCPSCRFLGLGSAIKIYNPNRWSNEIFGTVIHELGHASHWNMDSNGYNNSETIVAESWARGVQWSIGNLEYPGYIPRYFTNYTGVVQDMVDGTGGYDQVSGYSLRQIEDALNGQNTWINWRTNIVNQYNNATESNLANLFDFWD